MRNDSSVCGWRSLLAAALFTALVGGASVVVADDTVPPADARPATEKPGAQPAAKPADTTNHDDADEGADYDKNAATHFTPTERTPADRNVSFPVDI